MVDNLDMQSIRINLVFTKSVTSSQILNVRGHKDVKLYLLREI